MYAEGREGKRRERLAVARHGVVFHRHVCSAPKVTGVAVVDGMLSCFG